MDVYIQPKYKIVSGGSNLYRVVNLKTCDESALYSLADCEEIKAMAERGELHGSFNCNNF